MLLFLCCHPSLSVASQIALTLRAVGGLSTAEIARALLGSEQTVTIAAVHDEAENPEADQPLSSPGKMPGGTTSVSGRAAARRPLAFCQ